MIGVIGTGGGFKGLGAYLLHDEGAETADRVAWSATVNCGTDDPDRAIGRMCATAMAQDALKEAAGIKKTGRKLKHPLAHIVLSWHQDDDPSEAHMHEAARAYLKSIEADHLQALIVAHNDRPHPHLHIVLNRIDPETGVAHKLAHSQKKLQAWCLQYEKAHELRCEARLQKDEALKAGQTVESSKRVPRHLFELQLTFRLEAATNDNLSAFERTVKEQRAQDAALKARTREMTARHRTEFEDRRRRYSDDKARLLSSQRQHWKATFGHAMGAMRAFFDGRSYAYDVTTPSAYREMQQRIVAAEKQDHRARQANEQRSQARFLDLTFRAENRRLGKQAAKLDERLSQGGLKGFIHRLTKQGRSDRARRADLALRIAGNTAIIDAYERTLDQRHDQETRDRARRDWKPLNLRTRVAAEVGELNSGAVQGRARQAARRVFRGSQDDRRAAAGRTISQSISMEAAQDRADSGLQGAGEGRAAGSGARERRESLRQGTVRGELQLRAGDQGGQHVGAEAGPVAAGHAIAEALARMH